MLGFVVAYVSFSRLIDARLHGERERSLPRVYGRPVEFRRGQDFSELDLVARLNDLGYAQRAPVQQRGEFAIRQNEVWLAPRGGEFAGKQVKLILPARPPKRGAVRRGIQAIEVVGDGRTEAVDIDPPLMTALMPSGTRQKTRRVPLGTIPLRVQQAVLAIEDQSFYSHPGINPFRLALVAIRNLVGGEAPERRQHDHAAAGADVLPVRRVQRRAAERRAGPQPRLLPAQGAREPDVAGARDAARRSTRSSSCT